MVNLTPTNFLVLVLFFNFFFFLFFVSTPNDSVFWYFEHETKEYETASYYLNRTRFVDTNNKVCNLPIEVQKLILDFGYDCETQDMSLEKTISLHFVEPKITLCIAQFLHGECDVEKHSQSMDLRWHYPKINTPVYASFTLWSCRRISMEINCKSSQNTKNCYYEFSTATKEAGLNKNGLDKLIFTS